MKLSRCHWETEDLTCASAFSFSASIKRAHSYVLVGLVLEVFPQAGVFGCHRNVLFPQVHGDGGGYDSDFSGEDEGESSEKTLKR